MKKLFFLLFAVSALIACSNNDEGSSDDNNNNGDPNGTSVANIIVTAGGEQYKINGSCGWASVMDTNYIGVKDENNSLKTFSTFFNIDELPSQTTTYTLVKSPEWDEEDNDPTHIWMNVTEIRNGGLFQYTSDDNSGTITLVVTGNKVTVDLTGIVLQAYDGSNIMYDNLNVGGFSGPGTLSGSLEFYK